MSGADSEDEIDPLRERVHPVVRRALSRSFELGFLGSMPIDDQIDHGLGFVVIIEAVLGGPPASVVDLGTGGGVPGLVLVSCWPDTRVVLIDASERRTAFLQETLDDWPGSSGAEVIRGRAEELGRLTGLREMCQAVTSRSFGIPALTAECGSSFLALGGVMVVSEPPEVGTGERWSVEGLASVGLRPAGASRVASRFGYQVLRKGSGIDDRFPRRVGIPAKRPLF
jgi:16S rRNA (guanine527-N7)-methyltransferase